MNIKFIPSSFIIILLSGCASSNTPHATQTFLYTPADNYEITKTITVHNDYDHAWDHAVKNLSSTSYKINNIEKTSKIISISFKLNNPEKYIDCGKSTSTISYDNKKETINREYAKSIEFESVVNTAKGTSLFYRIHNETALSGTANIYFSPTSKNDTSITININYSLSEKSIGKRFIYNNGKYVSNGYEVVSGETALSTESPSTLGGKKGTATCKSKQTLESQILSEITN